MKFVNFNKGENVVHVERGSISPYVFRIVIGVLLLTLPTFFLFPLITFGDAGLILAVSIAGLGVYFLLNVYLRWKNTVCILTGSRIIQVKQGGIFDRQVTYASLKNVNDVAYRISGITGKIIHVGAVRVVFSGVIPSMLFSNIKHPQVLHDIITEMRSLPRRRGDAGDVTFQRVHVDI